MAVTVQQALAALQSIAPPALAQSWDNVGLLVDAKRPVTGILTALDITPAVVAEAAAAGCELIAAHHPVIFDPLKALAADDVPALLLKNGISAVCMHTNLDAAPGGVNDVLAGLLGMPAEREPIAGGCGRLGTLARPTTAAALAALCEEKLGRGVRWVEAGRPVQRLAVVSGAGGSFLPECIAAGADCLVTGEAAHHIALLARQKGIGLVAAGHWATEHPVTAALAAYLGERLPGIRVSAAQTDTDPFDYRECGEKR